MKNNVLVVVVLVALAAGVMWYMKQPTSEPVMEKVADQSPAPSEAMMASDVVEISVEGSEFKYSQDTMTLKKGQKVRLTLKNVGKMPHDFVVDELSVKTKTIKGGEEDVVEFIPDQVGTFEYYCSVGEHRAKGMKGMLTVE